MVFSFLFLRKLFRPVQSLRSLQIKPLKIGNWLGTVLYLKHLFLNSGHFSSFMIQKPKSKIFQNRYEWLEIFTLYEKWLNAFVCEIGTSFDYFWTIELLVFELFGVCLVYFCSCNFVKHFIFRLEPWNMLTRSKQDIHMWLKIFWKSFSKFSFIDVSMCFFFVFSLRVSGHNMFAYC